MTVAEQRTGAATGWVRFAADEKAAGKTNDDLWAQILSSGFEFLLGRQAESGSPGDRPACVYCFRAFGPEVTRNRLNRFYCDDCDAFIRTTPGQTEVAMPVLAVDIRNSTAIKQELGADWVPQIRRFRRHVGMVIQRNFGFVMNTAGDAVFAIFPPGFIPQLQLPLEDRSSESGRNALTAMAAANAIAAATQLAAESPQEYVGAGFPYGTALHTAPTLVFSVAGPDELDVFLADDGEFSAEWVAADPANPVATGPVSIDIAGDGIVIASELADAAPAAGIWITAPTDERADQPEHHSYVSVPTKAGSVDVRQS